MTSNRRQTPTSRFFSPFLLFSLLVYPPRTDKGEHSSSSCSPRCAHAGWSLPWSRWAKQCFARASKKKGKKGRRARELLAFFRPRCVPRSPSFSLSPPPIAPSLCFLCLDERTKTIDAWKILFPRQARESKSAPTRTTLTMKFCLSLLNVTLSAPPSASLFPLSLSPSCLTGSSRSNLEPRTFQIQNRPLLDLPRHTPKKLIPESTHHDLLLSVASMTGGQGSTTAKPGAAPPAAGAGLLVKRP